MQSAEAALLKWMKDLVQSYDLPSQPRDFATGYQDGLVLCALVHALTPTFDFKALKVHVSVVFVVTGVTSAFDIPLSD